jgi:phospholipid/cholesterol/gamma-HCH transport system ATP-binding protein
MCRSRSALERCWKVTFEVPSSRAFCLLGRSGTGKSVTLRHIIGLVKPDAGKVVVEDRNIAALDSRALSRSASASGSCFKEPLCSTP